MGAKIDGSDRMIQRAHAAALCVLFSVVTDSAFAQSTTSSVVLPSSNGTPHICGKHYPTSAIRAYEQGETTLVYRVGVDGHTEDFHVLGTSGHADLDNATIACASKWTYSPAQLNGRAVEVLWVSRVSFALGSHPPNPSGPPQLCSPIPDTAGLDPKPTTILLAPSAQTGAKTATVVESSGSQVFDGFAIQCLHSPETQEYLASVTGDTNLLVPFFWVIRKSP
jgi:TonB family protein